jgi:hypothetical protein
MSDLVQQFETLGIFERASEDNDMLRAWLLTPSGEGDEAAVIAEWPSTEAYQGWLENPARAEINRKLGELVEGEMSGGTYVVAHRRAGPTADKT